MIPTLITDTGAGLVYDGQDTPRADLIAAARQWLIDHGVHPVDADDQCADRRGLIVRSWWHDDHGHVQEHHETGRPVTVVHVYDPVVVADMDAKHAAATDAAARKRDRTPRKPALTRFPEAP